MMIFLVIGLAIIVGTVIVDPDLLGSKPRFDKKGLLGFSSRNS